MNPDTDNLRERGRRLRAEATIAEQKPRRYLRAERFADFEFRRHRRMGDYFADFCCLQRP